MASFEFRCPHCSERFELENPLAGGQVPCPLCSRTLAIPAHLPDRETEPPNAPLASRPEPSPFVLDVGESSLALGAKSSRKIATRTQANRREPLSREERDRRRQVGSLIWMIGGVILLAVAAFVLSRL